MSQNLPAEVIKTDKRLTKATDELAKMRWEWTLDQSNPDRVSFSAYARQVGANEATIRVMANGYAAWLTDSYVDVRTPGKPQTVSDHIELAKMGAERQVAVKAVAKHSGASVTNVAGHKRAEVDAVVHTARERAVDRGTTVEHEIERAAEWREKARRSAKREQDEKREQATMRYIEIEGDIGAAMQRLRKILNAADVGFSEEERELIVESLGRLRALMNLIDVRIAGKVDIDWDAELAKIGDVS